MFSASYPAGGDSNPLVEHETRYCDDDDEGVQHLQLPNVSGIHTARGSSISVEPNIGRSPPSPRQPLGKQNARSFFHSSYNGHADDWNPVPHYSSASVREQTAELATFALSDYGTTPPRVLLYSSEIDSGNNEYFHNAPSHYNATSSIPTSEAHRGAISSYLTHMFHRPSSDPKHDEDVQRPHTAAAPYEHDPLIPKSHIADQNSQGDYVNSLLNDVEVQEYPDGYKRSIVGAMASWIRNCHVSRARNFQNIRKLNGRNFWELGIVEPAKYLPAVILGLLLNVLDGLSYGMILFPLGQDIFGDLGPDGLSMFYVSCIVSQLVFSCGGSIFKGGIGSEMIEVVPFFHKMAFTILNQIGHDNPKSVIATTVLAYSLSSILTGAVFFALGTAKLGSLIGFFPRHILVGCIGGVGWFLVVTGIEVSARLEGNLDYTFECLGLLMEPQRLVLWIVPLLLAILLILTQRFIKSTMFMPLYFISIPIFFYILVGIILKLDITALRAAGWVFDAPAAGVPFWHFYTLYDFNAVDWKALLKTVPAMFALTFFGILHVPINVPALGVSTGEDNVDVDRELIAHGISNALSGFAGSIQNYLVYSNSILFMRAGGDSRIAGIMLAISTAGMMVAGPAIIGYIPVMVVGALIFLLGIELLKEALWDTAGKLSRLEYITIIAIVITMGAWDFVIGILIGVVLACTSFVVQTAQKSPIHATYSGVIARSTVRRHPVQQRFLREVGPQIRVVKLSGYMFFGTISAVESWVRDVMVDVNFQEQPIRFLIIDLLRVSGVDFSAAEAFIRMRRLLAAKNVEMILSGVAPSGQIAKSLRAVGVWADGETVLVFEDLNSALESCENEFLTALYIHRDSDRGHRHDHQVPSYLEVPKTSSSFVSEGAFHGSPRRDLVYKAATSTLRSQETIQSSKWQTFKQPLPLLLQIFQELTDKNEDFWFRAIPYFQRKTYPQGTQLFVRGDLAGEFYLIEEGILRAEYNLDQGKYSESILAGTTCGELPFFSDTLRTATVITEKDTVAWVLDVKHWKALQEDFPDVAKELLKISLKLTTERMHAITGYIYVGT
ncbi:sulfate transporter family-domain-containing protein [Geopyxis carbonaria]|nr:sulfate transporter family-domain-containing protein [Geopyxis carbonaria]